MRPPSGVFKHPSVPLKAGQRTGGNDVDPAANDGSPSRNRRPPQALSRKELPRHANPPAPKDGEAFKQGKPQSQYRTASNGSMPGNAIELDSQDDELASSETTPRAASSLKRKRAVSAITANGKQLPRPETTGASPPLARGTLASKSVNKGRHARVPIRSTPEHAVRTIKSPPISISAAVTYEPSPRHETGGESDASEDVLGPMDRRRRGRNDHTMLGASFEQSTGDIEHRKVSSEPVTVDNRLEKAGQLHAPEQWQVTPEPAITKHHLETPMPGKEPEERRVSHEPAPDEAIEQPVQRNRPKLRRQIVESEPATPTHVSEANEITLSPPTASDIAKSRQNLRDNIKPFEEAHRRYLKQSLSRARRQTKHDTGAHSTNRSVVQASTFSSAPKDAISESPKAPSFLSLIKPRGPVPATRPASSKEAKQLSVITFQEKRPDVPPYDYNNRAKRNKLALNHRCLMGMPNIEEHEILSKTGEIDPNEDPDFIEEVGEHFDMGLPFEHERDLVVFNLERYKQLQPAFRKFLDEEQCSDESIVCLFLDEHVRVRGARSPYTPKVLCDRALQEKCHLKQYIDVAPGLLSMLQSSMGAEQLEVALRASFAFQEELDMSIWPVAEAWLRERIEAETGPDPQQSVSLAGSVCRLCQSLECEEHGTVPDRESYSNKEANLDVLLHNRHKPVQSSQPQLLAMEHEPDLEDESLNQSPNTRTTKGGRSTQLQDSSPTSQSPEARRQAYLAAESADLHTDRCSKHCALDWKALDAAPYTDVEETLRRFKPKDRALARSLMPALRGSPQASCIIAAALNKKCSHVHYLLKQLQLVTEPTPGSAPAQAETTVPTSTASLPRSAKWWAENTKTSHIGDRKPFYPCSHEGTCADAKCSCFQQSIHCEKSCGCSVACERRFRGCKCEQKGIPCRQARCDCYRLMRECDPDLCVSCGATEALKPALRHPGTHDKLCENVSLQRGIPKRLISGTSQVKGGGFGLFAGEAIQKGELLGEYKGELVSKPEMERRKSLYKRRARHYTFDLNLEQEIDGTHVGNKLRFVNNSRLPRNINCEQHHKLCNTVSRIGLYATRDIQPGQEIFFDYGYPADQYKHFGEKKFVVVVKEKSKKKTNDLKTPGIEATTQSTSRIEAVFREPDRPSASGEEEGELEIRPANFRSDDEADEDDDGPEPGSEPEPEPNGETLEPAARPVVRPAKQITRGKKRKRFI